MMQMSEVEANLAAHLKDVRRKLSCSAITYVALIKDTHLLEVPEASPQICHRRLHTPTSAQGMR